MSYRIDRQAYAETYGPTVGDRLRLADTDLMIEIERDYTHYGDNDCLRSNGGCQCQHSHTATSAHATHVC